MHLIWSEKCTKVFKWLSVEKSKHCYFHINFSLLLPRIWNQYSSPIQSKASCGGSISRIQHFATVSSEHSKTAVKCKQLTYCTISCSVFSSSNFIFSILCPLLLSLFRIICLKILETCIVRWWHFMRFVLLNFLCLFYGNIFIFLFSGWLFVFLRHWSSFNLSHCDYFTVNAKYMFYHYS